PGRAILALRHAGVRLAADGVLVRDLLARALVEGEAALPGVGVDVLEPQAAPDVPLAELGAVADDDHVLARLGGAAVGLEHDDRLAARRLGVDAEDDGVGAA